MRTSLLILSTLVLLVFTGCSTKQVAKPNSFIKDVSLLKPVPNQEDRFYYLKEKVDLKKYNRVIVPDIKIVANEDIDKKLINISSIYFRNSIEKEFNEVLKENEGNNSLTLKVRIVSFESSFDDLEFYEFLPYSLAFKAISRGTGLESRTIRVVLGLKLIDTKTKETILLFIDKNEQHEGPSDKDLKFSDIKPIFDKWIQRYKQGFTNLNDGKYKK